MTDGWLQEPRSLTAVLAELCRFGSCVLQRAERMDRLAGNGASDDMRDAASSAVLRAVVAESVGVAFNDRAVEAVHPPHSDLKRRSSEDVWR